MSFREKDFLMRQIQELIKSFGKMVTVDSVKDFIHLDTGISMTEDELDQLIIVEMLKDLQQRAGLTDHELAENITVSTRRLLAIREGKQGLTTEEKRMIKRYLDQGN